MNFIKKLLVKKVLQKGVSKMFDSLKGKLDGKKTYVTAAVGLIVAAVGVLFGPVGLPGGIEIPAISSQDFFKYLWEALLVVFLRTGVAKG